MFECKFCVDCSMKRHITDKDKMKANMRTIREVGEWLIEIYLNKEEYDFDVCKKCMYYNEYKCRKYDMRILHAIRLCVEEKLEEEFKKWT